MSKKVPFTRLFHNFSSNLFKSNLLRWDLKFIKPELEKSYFEYKNKYQLIVMRFYLSLCMMTSSVIWAINPFNGDIHRGLSLVFNIGTLLLFVSCCFISHKYPRHTQKLIIFTVLYFSIFYLENSKRRRDSEGLPEIFFLINGAVIQIFVFSMVLAKIDWKYLALSNFVITVEILARLIYPEEYYKTKFYPLLLYSINFLYYIILSYFMERHDRVQFQTIKEHENSLLIFKSLIKEVLPLSILVTTNKNVLFKNKNAIEILEIVSEHEIFDKVREIQVEEDYKGQNMDMPLLIEDPEQVKLDADKSKPLTLLDIVTSHSLDINSNNNNNSPGINFKTYKGKIYTKPVLKSSKDIQTDTRDDEALEGERYFDIKVSNIIWENNPAVITILTTDTLLHHMRQLQAQDRYKNKILATVAHDLRTPLNGIVGMIESVIDSVMDKKYKKMLKIALTTSHHLLYMINDILDLSQFSNGKLRMDIKAFDLEKIIKKVLKLIKLRCEGKGLKLIFDNQIRRGCCIKSDPNRLMQILLNLLGNALKFTEKGSITLSLSEKEDSQKSLFFQVIDTGCGISKKDLAQLFKLFGTFEPSGEGKKMNVSGVGLGLMISQNLVKMLNENSPDASISVVSEQGVGSIFSFKLRSLESYLENDYTPSSLSTIPNEFPRVNDLNEPSEYSLKKNQVWKNLKSSEAKQPSGGFITPDKAHSTIIFKKSTIGDHNRESVKIPSNDSLENEIQKRTPCKILIVDDDQINILVARNYLEFYKGLYQYEVAYNGKEALGKILAFKEKREYFDIILLDCQMPVMDGYETAIEINKLIDSKEIPEVEIIASTGNSLKEDLDRCKEAGMKYVITKPYSRAELKSKLDIIVSI